MPRCTTCYYDTTYNTEREQNDVADFKKDLARGVAGEELLLSLWPILKRTDGRTGDFLLRGKKMEVKSDSYGIGGSPNFFMERYSNVGKQSNGGIWQANEHSCSYLFYWYPSDKIGWLFNVKKLLAYMNKNESNFRKVYVNNVNYCTLGYLVKRDELALLGREMKFGT